MRDTRRGDEVLDDELRVPDEGVVRCQHPAGAVWNCRHSAEKRRIPMQWIEIDTPTLCTRCGNEFPAGTRMMEFAWGPTMRPKRCGECERHVMRTDTSYARQREKDLQEVASIEDVALKAIEAKRRQEAFAPLADIKRNAYLESSGLGKILKTVEERQKS